MTILSAGSWWTQIDTKFRFLYKLWLIMELIKLQVIQNIIELSQEKCISLFGAGHKTMQKRKENMCHLKETLFWHY